MSFVATTICFSQERFDWPASRTQLIAKAASTLWLARLQSCQQDAVVPEAPCCQEFASAEAVTCSHPHLGWRLGSSTGTRWSANLGNQRACRAVEACFAQGHLSAMPRLWLM